METSVSPGCVCSFREHWSGERTGQLPRRQVRVSTHTRKENTDISKLCYYEKD